MAATIGARISDDKLELLKQICEQKGITISDLIVNAVEEVLEGKIQIRAQLPKISAMCPDCSMHLFYSLTKEEGPHLFCLRCGWWAKVKFPQEWHKGKFEI